MGDFNVGFIILVSMFHFGFSIMCYECNSANNPECAETVLPASLRRNCSEHDRGVTHTLCRKIQQFVDFEVNGKQPASRVIRSCGWDESKYKGACYSRSGYGGRQEVCSCTEDLCNGSHKSITTDAIAGTVLMVFIAKIV